MNWTPLVTPMLAAVGLVLAGILTALTNKAINAFQARTGIQLSDQQRQVIFGAVDTATGMVQTQLASGAVKLEQVQIANPAIASAVQHVVDSVPDDMRALGVTPAGIANMIVGRVGAAIAADPTIPTIAAPIPAPAA